MAKSRPCDNFARLSRLSTGFLVCLCLGHPLAVSNSVGLPADGEIRIGGVRLSGHLVRAQSGPEVAWVTDEPQQYPGRVWLELSRARAQTGLVPVLLADEPPLEWGDDQQDPSGADGVRLEEVFTGLWDYQLPISAAERLDPDFAAQRAPFGWQFPGLAPPEHVTLDPVWLAWALDGLESVDDSPERARIGLVRAVRPADVPAILGWFPPVGAREAGSEAQDIIRLVAVLRSWEDRFGATLLQLGPTGMLCVLAERPPATIEAATALAAEHWAFGESWPDSVQEAAAALIATPVWSFWWD